MRLSIAAAAALACLATGCTTYVLSPPIEIDEAWPARAEPVVREAATIPYRLGPGQTPALWSQRMVLGGGRGLAAFTTECKRLDVATEVEFLLHFPPELSPEVMLGGGHA